jgi:hypothetical protein
LDADARVAHDGGRDARSPRRYVICGNLGSSSC